MRRSSPATMIWWASPDRRQRLERSRSVAHDRSMTPASTVSMLSNGTPNSAVDAAAVAAAIAMADAAALLASRLTHLAARLDVATIELAAVEPVSWRGPAREAFAAARSIARDRLAASAEATHAAAALAHRAARLAESALP